MKLKLFLIAALLAVSSTQVIAVETALQTPLAGSTLWFSDKYTNAFYTIEQEANLVVISLAAGPNDDTQPIQHTVKLNDGQDYKVSVGGYGENRLTVTLILTRTDDRIVANVTTKILDQSLAVR
ncbi:MAG: hypothetical protein DHS20C09_00870 [marine bacterium B5-7]|nr:MAG: hypothetical protein DHS20C09_00870 [marine bacterium B5-7]